MRLPQCITKISVCCKHILMLSGSQLICTSAHKRTLHTGVAYQLQVRPLERKAHLQDRAAEGEQVNKNRQGALSQKRLSQGFFPRCQLFEDPHDGGPVPLLREVQQSSQHCHTHGLMKLGLACGIRFCQCLQRPCSLALHTALHFIERLITDRRQKALAIVQR